MPKKLPAKIPSEFATEIYRLLRKVPAGRVTTYKELAHAMNTNAYQAIGQVMRVNPFAPNVPCHRVVSANGTLGGFMGESSGPNVVKKIRLLRKEGVTVYGNKIANFEKILYRF